MKKDVAQEIVRVLTDGPVRTDDVCKIKVERYTADGRYRTGTHWLTIPADEVRAICEVTE